MRILLVVPPEKTYLEASAHERLDREREARPKLGILYVATYLKTQQPDVELKVLDCPAENIDFDQYEIVVNEFKPALVGITAVTFTIVDALKTARATKKILPETLVCIGGFHPTLFPRETLSQPALDFVVTGEGELTFNELVLELKKDRPELGKILGLGFLKNDEPVINPPRPLIDDLDSLPFPDYHLCNMHKYDHVLGRDAVTISLQSSRGCPFRCTFCDIRRTRFRFRSASSVVEEMSSWYKEGVTSFFIVDDNFIIQRKRLLEICSGLKEQNMKIEFKISARVDEVDRESLVALKEAGCSRINFGVESGHQKHLDYLEKGIAPLQTQKAFNLCHQAGIEAFAYMMIGIPGETREEMYDELNFLKGIKARYASFSVCSPYPRTKLYQNLLDDKTIKVDYWQGFAQNPTPNFIMPLAPGPYSAQELRDIQADLSRRFYMMGRIIMHNIQKIRNIRQFLKMARMGLRIVKPLKTKH